MVAQEETECQLGLGREASLTCRYETEHSLVET